MAGSMGLGLLSCVVAVFGFGTNYVPVKKVECGDGVFFACCMAFGIWLVGVVVDHTMASRDHGFEPVAMLGGMLWMSGNLLTPLVIKKLGIGLAISTWGLSNMLTGWATGHFGLFGVDKEAVNRAWMNYLGVAMAAVSIVLFAQAANAPAEEETSVREINPASVEAPSEGAEAGRTSPMRDLGKPLAFATNEAGLSAAPAAATAQAAGLNASESSAHSQCDEQAAAGAGPAKGGFSPLGFGLAIVAGVLFGSNFDPTTVLQQKGHDGAPHSTDCMDYVVSHFTGILATAGLVMMCYLAVKRRRSYVSPKLILPGMLAGAIWACAQTAWFQANAVLSLVVAFPIVTTLPGFIGMVWGVLFFGEFRSWRSRSFALAALACQIPGVVLIALSKA